MQDKVVEMEKTSQAREDRSYCDMTVKLFERSITAYKQKCEEFKTESDKVSRMAEFFTRLGDSDDVVEPSQIFRDNIIKLLEIQHNLIKEKKERI